MKDTQPINFKQPATMIAIQSLYIRNIEKQVNAEYIATSFSKNGLAQVSKVLIEPYKYKNCNIIDLNEKTKKKSLKIIKKELNEETIKPKKIIKIKVSKLDKNKEYSEDNINIV
jgi:coenzyme F420-reducing hydrogenase delta subunit